MSEHTAEKDAPYPITVETGVVHRPDCRYAKRGGVVTWPRWASKRHRACSVCLPDGLPTRVTPSAEGRA